MRRRGTFWGVLCAVMVLMGVFLCVPLGANATETPESYNLWVGGVQVTSENAGSITGEGITGTVSYDRGTQTLTLSGAAITGVVETSWSLHDYACIYTTENLNIVLVGENTLTRTVPTTEEWGNCRGIYAKGSDSSNRITLTISGEGSLSITGTGNYQGIYGSNCDVAIVGGTVTSQTRIQAYDLTIQGGVVTAGSVSDKALEADGKIIISGGTVTATSTNWEGIHSNAGNVSITGGMVTASGSKGIYSSYGDQCVSLSGSAHVKATGTEQAIGGTLAATTGYCRTDTSGTFTDTISVTDADTYFEYVGPAHQLAYTKNDDGDGHKVTCGCGTVIAESEDCSGGTATCTQGKLCAKCEEEYTDALGHSTGADGDLAATCKAKAYCHVCGSEYGEKLADEMDSATGKCQYGCGLDMAVASVSAGETGVTYYEAFDDALTAWTDGTTLTLLNEVTHGEKITIENKVVTLDLNGHTLDMSNAYTAIQVGASGNTEFVPDSLTMEEGLTIQDNSVEQTGALKGGTNSVEVYSSLCLKGGNLTGGIYVFPRGTVHMTGGSVEDTGSAIQVDLEGTFEISGGKLKGQNGIWNNGSVIISGTPEITGRDKDTYNGGAAVANVSGTMTVSGGPTLSGGAYGEFNIDNPVTFLTQPGEGKSWSVWMDTPGEFANPDNGVELDASKFTSKNDGYIVEKQDNGSLALVKGISDGDVTLSQTEFTYDGTEQKPTVSVTWGSQDEPLVENTNYTVTWENRSSVNADTYTVTIEGTGDYVGKVEKTYTINKAVPTADMFVFTPPTDLTYDGNVKMPTVTANKTGLGQIRAITTNQGGIQREAKNAGEYYVRIVLDESDNYTGLEFWGDPGWTFTIQPKTVTPTVTVNGSGFVYDGNAKEPGVTVKDGDTVIDSSEYTVAYSNNINAGTNTATVTVTDRDGGNYVMSEGSATFSIQKAECGLKTRPSSRGDTYTGQEEPLLYQGISDKGRVLYSLEENGEYSEIIPRKKDAGTYRVWFYVQVWEHMKQNYASSGKEFIDVTIAPRGLTVASAKVQDRVYDGTRAATLKEVVLNGICGNDAVEADFDKCEVTFNDANVGTNKGISLTKVVLKGADAKNYRIGGGYYGPGGSITPKAITPTVAGVKDTYVYIGESIRPKITVKDGSTTLMESRDYSVSYDPNVSATGKVRVALKGNYTGSWVKDFAIVKVEAEDQRLVKTELKEVPEGLKEIGYTSVAQMENLQRVNLTKSLGNKVIEGMAHYDVKLQYSLDGGRTWTDATEENFPKSGITVTIPYPAGTSRESHDFAVSHIFTVTSERLGTVAGDTETPAVTETESGIRVTLKGLSPVSVAWISREFKVSVGTVKNGSVQVTPSTARYGDMVTVTTTAWSGYSLQTLTVKDSKGNSLPILHTMDGKYAFMMQKDDVTVEATFASNYVADDTNPKTGDRIAVAVGVMAVSGLALAAAFVIWKKRKK